MTQFDTCYSNVWRPCIGIHVFRALLHQASESVFINAVMTLAAQSSLATMELLENGVAT